MTKNMLADTIDKIAVRGKGILAADESTGTIAKRFDSINVENTEENRRQYRSLITTAQESYDYLCGVIMFEETLGHKNDAGKLIPEHLASLNIVPGIKVDKGMVALGGKTDEKTTQGLDDLGKRLAGYREQGARFAKWRATYDITDRLPTRVANISNANGLARYAAICQAEGIVPIVEPEVLINGSHTLERSAEATEAVLAAVFSSLRMYHITLEHIILKPSMVISGSESGKQDTAEEVAQATVKVLKRTVPSAVPTINFLSGGQTPEQATANLNAMNANFDLPWVTSFSYGRALQEPCLKAWGGDKANIGAAQAALAKRCKLNSLASLGDYNSSME